MFCVTQPIGKQSAICMFCSLHKCLPILFLYPAVTFETFIVVKSWVCGYICIADHKAQWDRVKLWLALLSVFLLLRLELARLEWFRCAFKNSAVCTVLLSYFGTFNSTLYLEKKPKFILFRLSLPDKIKRTEQKHTIFSVGKKHKVTQKITVSFGSQKTMHSKDTFLLIACLQIKLQLM